MQFTLYYRGNLKSNGKPKHKHEIRQYFHSQLRELWQQQPLNDFRNLIDEAPQSGGLNLIINRNGFNFVPLISEKLALVAELDIQILWPQSPGNIIKNGGDIDNRLKTLFDSLKIPEANALPKNTSPSNEEKPFFCLFEDDSLITKLSVETDHLLEPVKDSSEVVLFIRVRTRQIKIMWGTIGLP